MSDSAKEFKNFINGKWVSSSSGRTFESHSPATGELVGTLQVSNAQDVTDAVEAADRAFEKWRKYP
ncbi:MAG TPA: aldehyde dehydrogenase family protein, partial [Anaerolineae bacterium]